MMDNPFLRRIHAGLIRTEEELRAFYRRSAKDLHPDTSPYTRDAIGFTRLGGHLEEALAFLRARDATAGGSDPDGFADVSADSGSTGTGTGGDTGAASGGPNPFGGDPGAARAGFLTDMQNLVALSWPFTRGRESRDASLRRHLDDACTAWDCWQVAEPGLFRRVEDLRREKVSMPGNGAPSDRSAWQSLEAFLATAVAGCLPGNPLPARQLLESRAREALLKLGRREGMDDVIRLVGILAEDLRSRLP